MEINVKSGYRIHDSRYRINSNLSMQNYHFKFEMIIDNFEICNELVSCIMHHASCILH
jgi:hypothetical protein